MKRRINYIKKNHSSLLDYFVFCKRNRMIKNRLNMITTFLHIFNHFKLMLKKQIILVFKYFFYNDYLNHTTKLIGYHKESNLKEKITPRVFNKIILNSTLDISLSTDFIFLLSLKNYIEYYSLFILLLLK